MSYVEKNLRPDEYIICHHKFHWMTFIYPSLLSFGFLYNIKLDGNFITSLIFSVPISYCFMKYMNWLTSEFVVTNTRIVVKYGLIFRTTFELLNHKIEGCIVNQGVLGRIFGYGTIIINGTGTTKQQLYGITSPFKFRDAIYDEIENLRIKNY